MAKRFRVRTTIFSRSGLAGAALGLVLASQFGEGIAAAEPSPASRQVSARKLQADGAPGIGSTAHAPRKTPGWCSIAAIRRSLPDGVQIANISNLADPSIGPSGSKIKTIGGVAEIPADTLAAGAPTYCFVSGKMVSDRETGKTVHFTAALPPPDRWNGRFLFAGCGGHCGEIYPPRVGALRKGYAIWSTDDGHIAQPQAAERLWRVADASYAIKKPGVPDLEALNDYYYRAVHVVTAGGKELTQRFYGADGIDFSYYEGCSDGGREGLVSISRFPDDFDGAVVGAPFFDMPANLVMASIGVQAQLRTPDAMLTSSHFALADRLITAKCDAVDGMKDGIVADPASCNFDPYKDVPLCSPTGSDGKVCFSRDQVDTLSILFSAATDEEGQIVYPAFSIAHISAENPDLRRDLLGDFLAPVSPPLDPVAPDPWRDNPADQPIAWYLAFQSLANLGYQGASDFAVAKSMGITFVDSPINGVRGMHAVIPAATAQQLRRQMKAGSPDPAEALPFLSKGGKLLLYHGYSDGNLTPYRTIQYYNELSRQGGGIEQTGKSARLFMVPGMSHCVGGPGPSLFGQPFAPYQPGIPEDPEHDALASLEQWVERKVVPQRLTATGVVIDPDNNPSIITSALCPFPSVARYDGSGDRKLASNWSCSKPKNALGTAGLRSGMSAGLR